MKHLCALFVFCIFSGSLAAQNSGFCGTTEATRELLEKYPEQNQYKEILSRFTQQYVAEHGNTGGTNKRSGEIYIIPVVFHIIHNYGPENISDERIYEQVERLNLDFRKLNQDTTQIVAAFQDVAADIEVEFRLATVDPQRNCTNGIDRVQSLLTYEGSDDSKLNPWPRDLYLNIWVVNDIARDGSVAAYAYQPSSVAGQRGLIDGIVIRYNFVGLNSRVLTHEVGHSFNLDHVWGGTNEPGVACGDDGIFDTPTTEGTFGCNLNQRICNSSIIENVQNYMDYSSCYRMFTEGQKVVMRAALNSDVSARNILWSEPTLRYTGADLSGNVNTCTPIADFNAVKRMVCVGEQVTFTDFSWRGPIGSWEWQFSDGTVSFDENPTVTFNIPGWQAVTLKVTNPYGQSVKTIDNYIYVTNDGLQVTRPFSEDFENPQDFDDNWVVYNYENNTSKWRLSNHPYSGEYSLHLNGYEATTADVDAIVTPPYSLLGMASPELRFQYSLASKGLSIEDVNDKLTIYYSVTCGTTWVPIFSRSGAALVTAGYSGTNFVPASEELWNEITITITGTAANSLNVRFKFEFSKGEEGNNLYIDNINVSKQYTSVAAPGRVEALNVYPVPARDMFRVEFTATAAAEMRLELFDIIGKNVLTHQQQVAAGANTIPVKAGLAPGIYTLSVTIGAERMVRKVVIAR